MSVSELRAVLERLEREGYGGHQATIDTGGGDWATELTEVWLARTAQAAETEVVVLSCSKRSDSVEIDTAEQLV